MSKPKAYIAVILLFLLLPHPLRSAIQFDPFVGYEGTIHEAGWFPVTCEVFNDGPSFNAVIEITSGAFGSDQVRQVPVELPTNTRKRVVVPMFASGGRYMNSSWDVVLKDSSGKTIIKPPPVQAKTVAWESSIMAAIPRTFGGTPAFPKLKQQVRPELQPEVARITVDQFPDNPIALEGLNAIYLNSEKAIDLKVNQVIALLGWVRSGGQLIIAVEQAGDINSTPWLKQFAPVELTDTINLKIDQELAAWVKNEPGAGAAGDTDSISRVNRPRRTRNVSQQGSAYSNIPNETVFQDTDLIVATGQVKDGFTLVSSQNHPLVVQAPRGRGKITVLTFSPEREPFRSWKSRDLFWAKLCGIPGEYFNAENYYGGGYSIDGVFGALIDSRQIKKLPVTWLLLLLVVYLVVIGPFDQWWLKKIGKQMLTWITFPSYVVLFSLLIYFIGYKLRAGETEWNELNIVDILPRGEKVDLRGHTYISIYSSGNTRYQLAGQQGYATLRGELMDFNAGGKEGSKARLVQQGNTFKADVEGLVWTSSLYANEWFKTNDTPFTATVTDTGSDYQVEIENLLNKPLTDVKLVANQLLFELDNVGPREKKTVKLVPSKGTSLRTFVQQNGAYFQTAVEQRRNALGESARGQLENRPLTATTASFISQMDELSRSGRSFISPSGLDMTPQVERGDAVIFAFVSDFSFTEKVNQFDPPRFKRDTLMRLSIPLRQKNPI